MLSLCRRRHSKRKLKNRILKQNVLDQHLVHSIVYALLSSFEEAQLETLLLALETRDGSCSACVASPNPPPHLGGPDNSQYAMAICKAYRWPDIQNTLNMRRMPFCESSQHAICLNPFHYSLFTDIPLTSFKPFSRNHDSCQGGEDVQMLQETETGSLYQPSFQGEDDLIPSPRSPYPVMTRSRSAVWCSLAYWEHRERVGRLFPVNHPYVNVFDHLPKGDGFCLSAVAPVQSQSCKVRKCIGKGVTLALDDARGVWLYNRSEYPVFVNSPVLEPLHSRSQLVHKLLPGRCAKVYDSVVAEQLRRAERNARADWSHLGRYDAASVRISFIKGWGPNGYRRQCITTCPCWLEVLFNT